MKNNIWFTSDTHYQHKNLCLGVSEWDDKEKSCRKFQILEEMNELIVKNINDNVKENDTLYHLGDWSFGGIENIWEFRKRINCKNIHLIFGNHDHHIINDKILSNCSWSFNKTNFIEDFPNNIKFPDGTIDHMFDVYTKDLFLSTQYYLDLKVGKQHLILSHYPIEEWDGIGHGYIHLHGHCHGKLNLSETNTIYRRFDVGCDTNYLKPYSWDNIKKIMEQRQIKKHNS